jgi:NTE family protein
MTHYQPIALALGGGAALGWAHLGVLHVLKERGVEIAAVAGTSIGAVVGAALAADKLAELEDMARSATMRTVLAYLDISWRGGGGMLGGKAIEKQLKQHFGDRLLEDLRMPCATVAADLISGDEVVIRTGSVVDAVRASLSLPGIFTPHMRDGQMLSDGGLLNPVPVDVARTLSTAPVVAVNLQGDYPARATNAGIGVEGKRPSMMRISRTSLGLLLKALSDRSLALNPPDLEIAPALGHIDVGDFTKADALIKIGRTAMETAWPKLAALITQHPDGGANYQ